MQTHRLTSKHCQKHGTFEAYVLGNTSTRCPRCSRLDAGAAKAGIPSRYRSKGFHDFDKAHPGAAVAFDEVSSFIDRWQRTKLKGANLILFGAVGTGKTHLATAAAMAVIEAGDSALYTRAAKITAEVKETWGVSHKTARAVYERFEEPDLLIIDEIGRQRATDTERLALFEVIHRRYESQRPTIAVTNLDGEGLRDYLGDAALDRLRENGTAVRFDWASARK